MQDRRGEQEDEDPILEGLSLTIPIEFHLLSQRLFSVGQIAHAVVDRTEWTDPTAKEPTEEEGKDDHRHRPQKTCIKRVGREEGRDGYQGVKLQEPIYRPSPQLVPTLSEPGRGDEPEKEGQKESLADATGRVDVHL